MCIDVGTNTIKDRISLYESSINKRTSIEGAKFADAFKSSWRYIAFIRFLKPILAGLATACEQ
jgi:hypothetical protein